MNFNQVEEIDAYLRNKPCVYESRPFGEFPICYRIAGKIYAQLMAKEDWFSITFKTNPEAADFYRQAYPGVVVRGYHCPPVQQPYWNTADLYRIEDELFYQMADEAYDEVVRGLSRKDQKKLPLRSEYRFLKTDGENEDFVYLCDKLDELLNCITNGVLDRSKYVPLNRRESLHDVIIAYKDGKPVGCGAYKFYDEETVELKRIYIDQEVRGIGLGRELLLRLEADARIHGFRFGILETGDLLPEATKMYQRNGYKVIPNYGVYVDIPESVCMIKKL